MFNTNNVESLKKKSANAIKIFQTTIHSLGEANKEVRLAKAKVIEKKSLLEQEEAELAIIEKQNENFMNKITSLFED